jgi:DnaJ-class molecular chaperone
MSFFVLLQHGDQLRLRARGIYSAHEGRRGDQLVEVRVKLPKTLNPRQKELILEFESEEAAKGSNSGQRAASGGSAGGAKTEETKKTGWFK